jgi:hypothetical protein
MTIDLLALQTTPLELPTASLTAGTYNQIRMDVTSGEIVFGPPGAPDPSDVTYPLNVPSDEIKSHLPVLDGETVLVTIDFDPQLDPHHQKERTTSTSCGRSSTSSRWWRRRELTV